MSDRPVRVLALPAFCNQHVNPYNALLYTAIRRLGIPVEEAAPWRLLTIRRSPAILHVHWPDAFFTGSTPWRAFAKAILLMAIVTLARARQLRIVWTVHNLRSHDHRQPGLERWLWRWFIHRVDAYIALTETGRRLARERFPSLAWRPGFVIPHGHYRDAYPDHVSRAEARAALGLSASATVLISLGTIRPYKNLPELIAAFRAVPMPGWRLLIAGKPDAPLSVALINQAAGEDRIRLVLGHIAADRMQLFLRAADLAVLPYHDILNSGSALLALSFGCPILVPDRGVMAELRATAGVAWVRTFTGALTSATLTEAVIWATAADREEIPSRFLVELDWDPIARQTAEAYRVVNSRPAVSRRVVG